MAKDCETSKPYRLSDAFGLQVMVAALLQLTEFYIDLNEESRAQDKLCNLQYDLQRYSDLLFTPESVVKKASTVTIRDFQFFPAELFKYQKLVLFVSDDRPDMWPLVDRETPIARNKDLLGMRVLFELVGDWIDWHSGKDFACDPSDSSRHYSDVSFVVFQHFTRKLWGGKLKKYGPRWIDSTHDAAKLAIHLRDYSGFSENAAILAALEEYPRIQPSKDKEKIYIGYVVSTADENDIDSFGAKKKIRDRIRKIDKEEW